MNPLRMEEVMHHLILNLINALQWPLSYPQILPSLFVFLDMEDLKSVRSVSKFWSVAGCEELLEKSYLTVPPGFYCDNLRRANIVNTIPVCFESLKIPAITIRNPRDIHVLGLHGTGRRMKELKVLKFLADKSPRSLVTLLTRCHNLTLLDMPPTPTDALIKVCQSFGFCPSADTSALPDKYTETLFNSLLDVYGSDPGENNRKTLPLRIRSCSLVLSQLLAFGPVKQSRIAELPVQFLQLHLDLSFHLIAGSQLPADHAIFANRLLQLNRNTMTELSLVLNTNSPPSQISFPIMPVLRKFAFRLSVGTNTALFGFPPGFEFPSHFPRLQHLVMSFTRGHFHMYSLDEYLTKMRFLEGVGVARSVRILEFDHFPSAGLDAAFMLCPDTETVIFRNFFGTGDQLTSLFESYMCVGLKKLQIHIMGRGQIDPNTLSGAGPYHAWNQPVSDEKWAARVGKCLGEIESALTGYNKTALLRLKRDKVMPDRNPAAIRRLCVKASILDCPG